MDNRSESFTWFPHVAAGRSGRGRLIGMSAFALAFLLIGFAAGRLTSFSKAKLPPFAIDTQAGSHPTDPGKNTGAAKTAVPDSPTLALRSDTQPVAEGTTAKAPTSSGPPVVLLNPGSVAEQSKQIPPANSTKPRADPRPRDVERGGSVGTPDYRSLRDQMLNR